MKRFVGARLPQFTQAQKDMLKGEPSSEQKLLINSSLPVPLCPGSHDFFGLNHYTSAYVGNQPNPPPVAAKCVSLGFVCDGKLLRMRSWHEDQHVINTRVRDGQPIGPKAASDWLYVVPVSFSCFCTIAELSALVFARLLLLLPWLDRSGGCGACCSGSARATGGRRFTSPRTASTCQMRTR